MGMFSSISRCSARVTSRCAGDAQAQLPNPNPRNFQIVRHDQVADWTVVEVRYPDATNYEGRKVMVFHARFAEIAALESLDPHFCDDGSTGSAVWDGQAWHWVEWTAPRA